MMAAPVSSSGLEQVAVSSGERPRLEFVDGMRALAALQVMYQHIFLAPSLGWYSHHWLYLTGATFHRPPVDVFIVLSGFCLMLPIARRGGDVPSWRTWFKRRALRILPPYYAALALSALLSVAFINPAARRLGSYLAGSLPAEALLVYATQLQDVFIGDFRDAVHNPPLWSIAVECKVYLFMPLILWSLLKLGNVATVLWTTAFGLCIRYSGLDIGALSPWYVGLFTMGAIAARPSARTVLPHLWRPAAFVLVLAVALVTVKKKVGFFEDHLPYFSIAIGAATALFVGAMTRDIEAGRLPLAARLLSLKPLVFIGGFSYSIYLVHNPLVRTLFLMLGPRSGESPERAFAILVAAMPLFVGLAYLFHLVAERPFMNSPPPVRTPFAATALSPNSD